MRTITRVISDQINLDVLPDETPVLIFSPPGDQGYWNTGYSGYTGHDPQTAAIFTAEDVRLHGIGIGDDTLVHLFTDSPVTSPAPPERTVTARLDKESILQRPDDSTPCLLLSLTTTEEGKGYYGPSGMGTKFTANEAFIYTIGQAKTIMMDTDRVCLFTEVNSNEPRLLTHKQLEVDKNWSRGYFFYLKNTAENKWKRKPGEGWSDDFRDAAHHPLSEAKNYLEKHPYEVWFLPRKESDVPMKKCSITQVLSSTLIDLCKAAPMNPLTRGHLMKKCGQEVPIECDTFEKIVEWIEWNVSPIPSHVPIPSPTPVAAQPAPAPTPRRVAFSINAEVSETETGRCNYRVNVSGSGELEVTENNLVETAEDCDSFEELIEQLQENLNGQAADDISLDDYSEYSHDDYDAQDHENWNCEISTANLEARVRSWLGSNSPALLRRLDGEE